MAGDFKNDRGGGENGSALLLNYLCIVQMNRYIHKDKTVINSPGDGNEKLKAVIV